MFVDFRTYLVEGSSKRAGEELEQESTRRQKVDEDKNTANLQSITAALIDVNDAQSKLVLLENFNENYSKCLRLLYKVNAVEGDIMLANVQIELRKGNLTRGRRTVVACSSIATPSNPFKDPNEQKGSSKDPMVKPSLSMMLHKHSVKPSKRVALTSESPPSYQCSKYDATMWYAERTDKAKRVAHQTLSMCCLEGKLRLPQFNYTPPPLKRLLDYTDPITSKFRELIWVYKSMICFTSFGAKIDHSINSGKAPYTFGINGQKYHRMGYLLPAEGVPPRYGYVKNNKKTVKNEQAQTRESEEYKKKPKNQSRSQKSQASVKSSQTMVKAQRGMDFALKALTKEAQTSQKRMTCWQSSGVHKLIKRPQ
ncbi:hypothetical protein Tco_0467966 [Tanacetum coccineum]